MGIRISAFVGLVIGDGFAAPAVMDPWYIGKEVAMVSLEAPEGDLPDENLEPLLRSQQGDQLDPILVRADIAMLSRIGAFSTIEAEVEPWIMVDVDGRVGEAVLLTYRVVASPRLTGIDVSIEGGARGVRKVVNGALGLHRGQVFHASDDLDDVEARVLRALQEAGWADASVSMDVAVDDGVRLFVQVVPGTARSIEAISIAGDVVIPEKQLRRWMRRHGVANKRRLALGHLAAARETLIHELVQKGWMQARVQIMVSPGKDNSDRISVLIEAGPQLIVEAIGKGLPRRNALHEVMGIYAGDRVYPGIANEAEDNLTRWFETSGYREAQVSVRLEEGEGVALLTVDADRGDPHVLKRIRVNGGEAFGESYLAGTVREAAEETLGDGVVTDAGLSDGVRGLEEFYRGQGFLSAHAEVENVSDKGPRFRMLPPFWAVTSNVTIAVEEGPRTTLAAFSVQGGVGFENSLVREVQRNLVGGPLAVSQLERVAREVEERYRDRGYLNATADLGVDIVSEGRAAEVMLNIQPGNRYRLRSIIFQGVRRTRRHVLARELPFEVGDYATAVGLEETRARLVDLDLFDVVNPNLVGDDDRSKDLVIHFEEKPNIMVEAGGGVSTDQGILAKGRTTHRNLGGFGHSISGLGQVGYGWLGDEWRLDTQEPVWKAALLYEAPYVPGPGKRLVMELLLGEAIREPTYRLTQTGGSVGLRWNPSDQWSIFVDYRVQMRVLEDADPGALVVGDPWLETLGVDDANTDAFYTPSDPRLNSGPSALLRFDGRDDRFDPKEGLLVSMRFEVGDGFLADPVRVRSQTRLEELVPAGPVILALGGQFGAGWVAGEGTLPLEERFYLGGNSSFRGFLLNRVGPANHSARPDINYPSQIEPVVEGLAIRDDSDHWVATGGDAMGALSMEVRVPMSSLGMPSWDTTSMVFFCDVGRVGFLNPNIATTSQLEGRDPLVRVGLGTGIRFASPIGPASVELGFNPWRLTERDEAFIVPHLSLGAL